MKKYVQKNVQKNIQTNQPNDNGEKYSLLIIILALTCLLIIQSIR